MTAHPKNHLQEGTGLLSQIEHLRGREKALEPLGWTGREAEWIALVCLHSGIFTRSQFCSYRNTNRMRALRLVRRLVEQSAAIELTSPMFSGGARACRISSKRIYRALGVENLRHRRAGTADVTMRRLVHRELDSRAEDIRPGFMDCAALIRD